MYSLQVAADRFLKGVVLDGGGGDFSQPHQALASSSEKWVELHLHLIAVGTE